LATSSTNVLPAVVATVKSWAIPLSERSARPAEAPVGQDPLAALRRAAAAWTEDAVEVDRFLDWNRQELEVDRPEAVR
jgi:hypothetical protein